MNLFIKRSFDIIFGILLLIIMLPIFIIISIAIKLDSNGPIFFKQCRLGKNGKTFTIIKFRSMIVNAENLGTGIFNMENDIRVTKVGSFLRNTSIDEIPQIFNVITGKMSFVGPRPPLTYELGDYEEMTNRFKARFTVKPGITGLSQINGRNSLTWDQKIKYDLEYIKQF
ncbi:sugar transferase, partial [bacterium]|nr:sugar transferase [bacterium]